MQLEKKKAALNVAMWPQSNMIHVWTPNSVFDTSIHFVKWKYFCLRILGLQPRGKAAMLVVNTIQFVSQNLHENRV